MNQSNTAIIQLQMPTGGASDENLKQDITPLPDSLKKVLALQPVTWHWKDDQKSKELQYGFIAQDVEKIFPHMVSEHVEHNGQNHKFLAVGEMTPHIVKAIKEQNDELHDTTQQIEKLTAHIKKQQKEIEFLQNAVKNKA